MLKTSICIWNKKAAGNKTSDKGVMKKNILLLVWVNYIEKHLEIPYFILLLCLEYLFKDQLFMWSTEYTRVW